ncbi:MAG: peptide-methionine (S)-S-oxide reductase [Flavobacteriales bacterium]|nr:peptide-methionine (S)-S-oxide reductase [Flavobacteriales bacterium]|tara:strand:+ start:18644 stop:19171 length:528 start_codon:yes stop_codon:yes gene_type:complete
MQKITLGAGCFWCVEAIYKELIGVEKVEPGYSGGKIANPTYREVCSGLTGHAEVIQLEYDESVIDFKEILEVFFKTHDPTTLNRQGADVGTQYRSAIFYHNENQKEVAEKVISELENSSVFDKPVVTEVTEFTVFYPAEEYHKNYYKNNPEEGYCQMVVRPKVEKFKKVFEEKLK